MAKDHVFHYGGQAVIEGVMIRGSKYSVTAVRKPDKTIHVDKKPLPSMSTGKWRSVPLIRGILALIESLVLGIQTLMVSADIALADEEAAKKNTETKKSNEASNWYIWLILLASMAFAVAVFFLGPLYLTKLTHISTASPWFNIVEGLVRIAIFVLYIRLVSLMPDIKRVFAYHGAEHKAVNGFEANSPLEPESLRKFSKAHVRCGGSFLFVVLIIAIVVFVIVGIFKPVFWALVLSRIILVPVIAALGYEVIYFGARHTENIFVKIILAPGMWLQSMTTREPETDQLEVAIAALKGAVEADQGISPPAEQPAETQLPPSTN
ncbi:MAG TPA: DUF1385 domain-containing protein [Dehalococcoidales bacterium]|nr:DUF1385 domain-containing protein [Dehalococcoidales bacterium]